MEPKRLNKFISDAGFCSRREADQLIEHERVTVNGKQPAPGMKVTAKDKVRIDGQILNVREEAPVFLLFNKPAGIATTTDRSIRNNIISALNYPASLQPVGFLDRESEGLLFLTNDTELAARMTKADNHYEKEYVVTLDKMITPDFLEKISESGSPITGAPRRKSAVTKEGTSRFRIVLEPGMYHNIKRRCEDLGYKVQHLQRVRIGSLTSAKLPVGMWRALSEAEVETLRSVVAGRSRKASQWEDEDSFTGYAARRSTPGARSKAGGPAGAARPGNKAQGIRKTNSAAASGPGTGGKASASRSSVTSGPGGRGKAPAGRSGAAKGGAKRPAAANRNSTPKGRRRG